MNVFDLHPDMLKEIFHYLTQSDLNALRLVCKRTKTLVDGNVVSVKRDYWRLMRPLVHQWPSVIKSAVTRACTMWPSVKVLDFTGVHIGDKGAKELSRCRWTMLEQLIVRDNGLSTAGAKSIAVHGAISWPQLRKLDLSHNKLKDGGFLALINADWRWLEHVDLSSCEVSSAAAAHRCAVPAEAWPSLQELILDGNRLSADSMNLLTRCDWPMLEVLSLKGANLNSQEVASLPLSAKLRNCWPRLRHLDLGHFKERPLEPQTDWNVLDKITFVNNIGFPGASSLAEASLHWHHLKTLNLSRNLIGIDGVKLLKDARFGSLEDLDLSWNGLGPEGATALAGWWCRWPVRSLNLQGNNIQDEGVLDLLAAASTHANFSCLEELNLANNRLSFISIEALAGQRPHSLNLLARLRKLSLANNSLGDGGAQVMRGVSMPCIEEVDLSHTGLDGEAASLVLMVMSGELSRLRRLELSGNPVGGTYGIVFDPLPQLEYLGLSSCGLEAGNASSLYRANAAGQFTKLTSLDLSDNALESYGLFWLFKSPWPNLVALNLCGNNIGQAKAPDELERTVSNAFVPALKALHLGGNNLSDAGFKSILRCSWMHLQYLNIERNNIGPKGVNNVEALTEEPWRLPHLRCLVLSGNKLGNEGAEKLINAACSVEKNTRQKKSSKEFSHLPMPVVIGACIAEAALVGRKLSFMDIVRPCIANYVCSSYLIGRQMLWESEAEVLRDMTAAKWPSLETIVLVKSGLDKRGMQIVEDARVEWPALNIIT